MCTQTEVAWVRVSDFKENICSVWQARSVLIRARKEYAVTFYVSMKILWNDSMTMSGEIHANRCSLYTTRKQ